MKEYSVLCMQEQYALDKIVPVCVCATDEEDAKQKALNNIRKTYPNAMLAIDLPGVKVVMEVNNSLFKFVDDYIYICSTLYDKYETKIMCGQELFQRLKDGYLRLGLSYDFFSKMMIVLIKQPMLVDKKCSFREFSFMLNIFGCSARLEDYKRFQPPIEQPDEVTKEGISIFIKSAPVVLSFEVLRLIILFLSIDGITEARKQYIYDFYKEYFET